ncbi:MAG: CoA-binding protein [Dehalococcoidia bacterium]|nr:CoA-binding protein [Dehalococcoidia bacterium]
MVDDTKWQDVLTKLKRGITPRNVAVVGAARHNEFRWIQSHLPFHNNNGKVFHVNLNEDEWPGAEELGVQNFHRLVDIEEPIDYVTISVPRKFVPLVVQDCIEKGVSLVHIYTAGFEESGEEEGIALDRQISSMARQSGTLIMGPNCMGLFNPAVGIRQSPNQYYGETGNFGYISQSGSMASAIAVEANSHGIKMTNCISMGNGMILDLPDYIEYFLDDQNTKVVGMYIEGLRDPDRFFKVLKKASASKPMLVWKVGLTEDSARATEAHTGTSFIREDVWHKLLARCGAIGINSQDEMVDTVKAISLLPEPTGYNVGLYAVTGGHSTDMANVFSKNGFKIPALTESSYEELRSFYNMIGGNYVNPIQQAPPEHFERIAQILSKDGNIDIVALEMQAQQLVKDKDFLKDRVRILKEARDVSNKPVVACIADGYPRMDQKDLEFITKSFADENIVAFYSFRSAAEALKNLADYYVINRFVG